MSRYGESEDSYRKERLYEEVERALEICSVADLLEVITDVIRDKEEAE